MRLTSARPGDLLKVDDGLMFYAELRGREGQRVRVRPLCGAGKDSTRWVSARDVVGLYRKAGARGAR
jgi:hypothetical protein